ncbi:hypothetical protein BX616_002957 [Lobosporangium transversale]|uniref:F-box domain-containing protein n=1 Tax=Lobosporangium transversale TaxID=64571 RepID=A0A1Y2GJB2_9FUNG|nr:hypothetical protein BCR41DRAFT_397555 [Lobosporangium transversale]KAF9916743.1 hypothetical protein BX616_002957 [Lobosporangium transversale]ORZ12539.1 hypothetical protein BCR41DRAFT_397555 [Lobosporangium transversale]|eukprot:XP_021880158.1 hypothetical protein BCR41DRAFT_397555 [Lobosporangium transversale]
MDRSPSPLPFDVLVLIGFYLDQSDLINCILVSKDWSKAFKAALYYNIRVCFATYTAFISLKILEEVSKRSRHIYSIEAPHPSFVGPLLENVAVSDRTDTEPWFPRLWSLSILFDQEICRALRPPKMQPTFYYPSDLEDQTDDSDDDGDDDGGMNLCSEHGSQPQHQDIKGKLPREEYRDILAPVVPVRADACLTQDPYDVIRLIRQCSNLQELKVQVRVFGNVGGLEHLLWPGILPQSLKRLEIIVPDDWREESYDDSEDEDYDHTLYPARDVEEEYEEDEDDDQQEGLTDDDDGYDEDELVRWYHNRLPDPEPLHYYRHEYFNNISRQPLVNLQELILNNVETARALVRVFIARRCPHLRLLHLIDPGDYFCERFDIKIAETSFEDLTELKVELRKDSSELREEHFSNLLVATNWKSIVLRNFINFSYESLSAIRKSSELSLEILDLGVQAGGLMSSDIQQFLKCMPQLRVFSGQGLYFLAQYIGDEGGRVGRGIEAGWYYREEEDRQQQEQRERSQSSWLCAETLEVMRCQIMLEVPCFNCSIKPPIAPRMPSKHSEEMGFKELQKRVMKQLGQCYQLRELDLSHWSSGSLELRGPHGVVRSAPGLMGLMGYEISIYGDPRHLGREHANVRLPWTMTYQQSQCLEFTLETGLQELEGLKELRKLDLTGLKHKISINELRWMREKWPQLEQFKGLMVVTRAGAGVGARVEVENDDGGYDRYGEGEEELTARRKREEEMCYWLEGGEVIEGDHTFWRSWRRD